MFLCHIVKIFLKKIKPYRLFLCLDKYKADGVKEGRYMMAKNKTRGRPGWIGGRQWPGFFCLCSGRGCRVSGSRSLPADGHLCLIILFMCCIMVNTK